MTSLERESETLGLTTQWLRAVGDALESDSEYVEVSRWLAACVLFEVDDEAAFTLYFHKGRLIDVDEGAALTGSDFIIGGPSSEWERLLSGEIDFGRATTPPVGKMKIKGNVVKAAGNMRALFNFFRVVVTVPRAEAVGERA